MSKKIEVDKELLMLSKSKRPKIVQSSTESALTGCGKAYIIIGTVNNKPYEVFSILGKCGGCAAALNEALTRSISQGLRYGVPVEEYTKLLIGIRCPSPGFDEGLPILSCPDAIGQLLQKAKKDGGNNEPKKSNNNDTSSTQD